MNAGLPGTGIGGLFYIASALWMPIHRVLRGHANGREWRRIFAQGMIATGILWALAGTAWVLGVFLTPVLVAGGAGSMGVVAQNAQSVFRWVALIGTAGLLVIVLFTVEVMRLFVRRRPMPAAARVAVPRTDAGARLSDVA